MSVDVLSMMDRVDKGRQLDELINGPLLYFQPRKNAVAKANPHPLLILKPSYYPTTEDEYRVPAVGAPVYKRKYGTGGTFKQFIQPKFFGLPDNGSQLMVDTDALGRPGEIQTDTSYWALVIDLDPEECAFPIVKVWNYNAAMAGKIDACLRGKYAKRPFWGWDSCAAFLVDRYQTGKGKSKKNEVSFEFMPEHPVQSVKDWIEENGGDESIYAMIKTRADDFDLCKFLVCETPETLKDCLLNREDYDKDLARERRDERDERLKKEGKYPYAPAFLANDKPATAPPAPPPPPVRLSEEQQASYLNVADLD